MKKNILIFSGFIILLATTSLLCAKSKETEEPVKAPDLEVLNVQKWDEAFYKLVPPPMEDGNAATYFLKAIHNRFVGDEEQKKEAIYPWLKDFKNDAWKSDKPEDIELMKKALQMPELDDIVKGSMQKNFQIYGIYAMPSPIPRETIYTQPLPEYMNIIKMTNILMARADKKLAAGDVAGAEADMFAAIRTGHILQRDVILIGYMVGSAIELNVAKEMPDFYKKLKQDDKAQAWTNFLPQVEKHRDESKIFMKFLNNAKKEEIKKITDNPSLPRSFRLESLVCLIGNYSLAHPIRAYLFGLPEDTKEFAVKEHFNDPEMVIIQFKIIEDVYLGLKAILRNSKI